MNHLNALYLLIFVYYIIKNIYLFKIIFLTCPCITVCPFTETENYKLIYMSKSDSYILFQTTIIEFHLQVCTSTAAMAFLLIYVKLCPLQSH